MNRLRRRSLLGLALLPAGATVASTPSHAELLRLLQQFNRQQGEARFARLWAEWLRLNEAGQAGDRERGWLVMALLDLGRFDEAEALSRALPGWAERRWPQRAAAQPGPAATRRYWQFDAAQQRLQEQSLQDAASPQLWVQSAHGCGFCRLAAAAFSQDAELAALLEQHSRWFARGSDLFRLANWAEAFSRFPMHLVTARDGWPFPEGWATPRFHFVRGGQVLSEFAGWPGDGSYRPRLVQGLRAIGLI